MVLITENDKPNSLQSMNLTPLKAALVSLAMLKLQAKKVQSVKTKEDKLTAEKSQFLNTQ
jgi:hypothetical protein